MEYLAPSAEDKKKKGGHFKGKVMSKTIRPSGQHNEAADFSHTRKDRRHSWGAMETRFIRRSRDRHFSITQQRGFRGEIPRAE